MGFTISAKLRPDLTQELTFLRGEYSLWDYSFPYFSVVVPLSFVIKNFSLIDEIPEAERIEWSVQELFQRDIAWKRIDEELLTYLRNKSRVQFFNALTVALLPKDGHAFSAKYKDVEQLPPIEDDSLDAPLQVGGIQIQNYKGSEGLAGKIRWDKKYTIAVAVDGQHRLAAIKKLDGSVAPDRLDVSSVPVIFLIPHPKVGYTEPKRSGDESVILSLRRVFIDLNKNARPVSTARNILLDDQDVVSVCTRALVSQKLSATEEQSRVPLSLVDWVSDSNKFDTGPFLSTVLILREIASKALGNKVYEPEQENDPNVKRWLQRVFCPTESEMSELMSQVNRCYYQEVPLTFGHNEIAILRSHFEARWSALLTRVFRELRPYKQLWDYAREKGTLKPEWVNLYISDQILEGEEIRQRAERIERQIKLYDAKWSKTDNYDAVLEHIDNTIKDDKWPFKVVFQKALFASLLGLLEQANAFFDEEELADARRDQFVTLWIEAMNALLDSKFGMASNNHWVGIGRRPDGTIDHTEQAVKRLTAWLNIWVCLYVLKEDAPTYVKLTDAKGTLATIIRNQFSTQVAQGFVRVARASFENLEDDAYQEKGDEIMRSRYNDFRNAAKKPR